MTNKANEVEREILIESVDVGVLSVCWQFAISESKAFLCGLKQKLLCDVFAPQVDVDPSVVIKKICDCSHE